MTKDRAIAVVSVGFRMKSVNGPRYLSAVVRVDGTVLYHLAYLSLISLAAKSAMPAVDLAL
jgi:hypothetical protein